MTYLHLCGLSCFLEHHNPPWSTWTPQTNVFPPITCLSLIEFFTLVSPLSKKFQSSYSPFDTIVLRSDTNVSKSGCAIFISYIISSVTVTHTECNISLFCCQLVSPCCLPKIGGAVLESIPLPQFFSEFIYYIFSKMLLHILQ